MPRGRPKKQIDKEQFEKLCSLQCTLEEFCCYFDCNMDTLENWCKKTYLKNFSEVFKVKRGGGKVSLRRKQFEVAMSGNPTMLIWLGRNMLDQSENNEKISLSVDVKDDALSKSLKEFAEELKSDD